MKKTNYLETLEPGAMYHIYNRGINGASLFYKPENYPYFLSKYAHYLGELLETFAYCLLGNHFHMLVRVKDDINLSGLQDLTGLKEDGLKKEGQGLHHPDKIVSKKFSDFFNSYTKSINKAIGRTGGLFETPFKRIKIDNPVYFSHVLAYIHFNPQNHGFVDDFRDYEHSSYH
ncbi:MAG: transposase, partial [Bacteroidia bacterium]